MMQAWQRLKHKNPPKKTQHGGRLRHWLTLSSESRKCLSYPTQGECFPLKNSCFQRSWNVLDRDAEDEKSPLPQRERLTFLVQDQFVSIPRVMEAVPSLAAALITGVLIPKYSRKNKHWLLLLLVLSLSCPFLPSSVTSSRLLPSPSFGNCCLIGHVSPPWNSKCLFLMRSKVTK